MMHPTGAHPPASLGRRREMLAVGLVFLVFAAYASGPAPATNEAHYLARSKHFWNPQWCARDLFLMSPESHPLFHLAFGWLTRFLTLPMTGLICRTFGWAFLAVGWVRLAGGYSSCFGRRSDALGVHGRASGAAPDGRSSRWSPLGWTVLGAAVAVVLWDRGHMAGEWIVGGFEAKVVAYGFVFSALAFVATGRWGVASLLAGVATAFHPLVGGWSLLAMAFSWSVESVALARQSSGAMQWRELTASFRRLLPSLLLAAALALIGVLPALGLDGAVDEIARRGARRIYVHWRLGHHLVPFRSALVGQMSWQFVARHGALVVVWWLVWRSSPRSAGRDRVQWVVAGCILIALVGTLIEWVTMKNWIYQCGWMRYYWYRMTDAMVPMGISLAGMQWLACSGKDGAARLAGPDRAGERSGGTRSVSRRGLVAGLILLAVVVSFADRARDRFRDGRPLADRQGRSVEELGSEAAAYAEYQDWVATCQWCRNHTDASSLFLTPTYAQTFKWYAGRAEFVTWKDVPQGAVGLIEWMDRRRTIRRLGLYADQSPPTFANVQQALDPYQVDYVIVRRHLGDVDWPHRPVFGNRSYEVYRVRGASD